MTAPARPPRYVVAILLLTFLVALAAVVVPRLPAASRADERVLRPCASRIPVVVAASSEKYDLLAQLAQEYDGPTTQRPTDLCAQVQVTKVNSGDAAAAFNQGWDETRLDKHPDVWTPASSAWLGFARAKGATAAGIVPVSGPSIAQSPLVIAMPKPMAQTLGWPNRALGWPDLARLATDPRGWAALGHPEWGPFTLGKTNPAVSTSGLYALLGAYQATPGTTGDELTAAEIEDPQAYAFEKSIENAVVHYGSTELEFLENLYRAQSQGKGLQYASAVAVEEKSVWDYNQGNPSGDPATLRKMPPPTVPLVAFTPSGGTYVSDSPYAVLDTVSGDKRTAADDFGAWLLEREQQEAFQRAGFHDAAGRAGAELSAENGFPSTPPRPLPLPPPEVVAKAVTHWNTLRKPANVTLVLDRSGSMGNSPGGPGSTTNLDRVRPAAYQALARLAPADTLSLWTFSSASDGQLPYQPVVPAGPVTTTAQAIRTALQNLTTSGDTALYRTSRDIVAAARASYDPTKINAIVLLTDGQETVEAKPQDDPEFREADVPRYQAALQATEAAIASDPTRPTRVFYIAYSGETDFDTLKELGLASGGYAYDSRDPAEIQKAFDDVISNF